MQRALYESHKFQGVIAASWSSLCDFRALCLLYYLNYGVESWKN